MADDEFKLSQSSESLAREIDEKIGNKYGISLLEILTNPEVISTRENSKEVLDSLKNEVDDYFNSILENLGDEQKEFESQLKSITAETERVNKLLSEKAATSKTPFMTVNSIERDLDKEETLVVNRYEDSTDKLVDKLMGVSYYVADVSTAYKEYSMGSWLFSGNKNYVLSLTPPDSVILELESSREEISSRLDEAETLYG